MTTKPVIVTKKLSKRYPGAKNFALRNLSITVRSGEVYGFIGPNGAGKSTAIRLLLNLILPTNGSASIIGMDSVKDSKTIRKFLGYLSGDFQAYPRMRVSQFLEYMNELQPPKRRSYTGELTSLFKLNINQKIGDLSKGNRQKVGVVQAFMHEPEILILDEPSGGLDPLMQEVFYDLVRQFKQRGSTFFVSSHNLSEVQKICDRIGFIREGKLLREQTIADLATEAAQTFDIGFIGAVPINELKKVPGAQVAKVSQESVTVHMHGDLSRLFAVLARHKVKHLTTREVNIKQEFLRYYKEENQV